MQRLPQHGRRLSELRRRACTHAEGRSAIAQALRLVEAQLRVQRGGVAERGAARGQPVDALEQHTEVHGGGAAVRVEVQRRLVRTARRFRLAALLERVGSVEMRGGARHRSDARPARGRKENGRQGDLRFGRGASSSRAALASANHALARNPASMSDDGDCLQSTLAAWEKVRLSERHAILDQQGLQIADNREEASAGRGALKDVIRAFKSTPQEERAEKIGGVVKAFQAEVDALTRRQAFAEGAFLDLYRSLDAAPDPLPALKEAVAAQRAEEARRAEHEATKRELANYEKEFAQLTNQAQTIKGLKAQLREAEARAQEAVGAARRETQETSLLEQQQLQASAQQREAEMEIRLQRLQAEAPTRTYP